MQGLDTCKTVGEAKKYLSQYSDDMPFETENLKNLLCEYKGSIYLLTYRYILLRFRQFLSDLMHLDDDRLSTLLFITVTTWIILLICDLLYSLMGFKVPPNLTTVVTTGLYASAITAAPKAAVNIMRTIKSFKK